MRAERTWSTDVRVTRHLDTHTRLVATVYTWEEQDGTRLLNVEPRIVDERLF